MTAPSIEDSTTEERESFIRNRYRCISDCDACGICAVFKGKDPALVFRNYIDGRREYMYIAWQYTK